MAEKSFLDIGRYRAFVKLLLVISAIFTSVIAAACLGAVPARADAKNDVAQQLIDLRLNRYFEVESAKKVHGNLYSTHLTGMGATDEPALLYKPERGGWVLMLKTRSRNYGFVTLDEPLFLFSLNRGAIMTRHAPAEVRRFLSDYFDADADRITFREGANVAAVWYPKKAGGEVGDLLQDMGLKDEGFLSENSSRHHGEARIVGRDGMLVRGTYDYLAQGESIVSLVVDLAKPPSLRHKPHGLHISDKDVALAATCRVAASLDFFKTAQFDETDCQLEFTTDVRVDVNKTSLPFTAAIGIRSVSRGNSRAFSATKELGFNPNRDVAMFIDGTLNGHVWRNIFGKRGFDLNNVELQALIDRDTGWHMGIFGQLDFGDATRMTAAVLLPVNLAQATFGDVAMEASLDKLTLDQLVMLPAAIGGPKTYPRSWRQHIRDAGLNRFYLQNVKFTFAPNMSDPDLGIDQSGVTVRGSLAAFNQELGSVKVFVNQDGTYLDDAVQPFRIGWFTLKNARLKMFIPSSPASAAAGRAKRLLGYAGQNAFVFFFDTDMNVAGQTERAIVSFLLSDPGVEFDANITRDLGLGVTLRLPLSKIADGKAPFDVSGYFHDKARFGKTVRKIVHDGVVAQARKTDTSLDGELSDIKKKQAELKSARAAYEKARDAAEKRAAKAEAPLKHAEAYLNRVNGHLNGLHGDYEHWKHKYNHTKWYHVKARIHDLAEEGRYYSAWVAYKGTVDAARAVVESVRKSTHFISVDADPTVVETFSAYNGAKFGLAIAKGALIAAKKSNDLLAKLPDLILNATTKDFSIKSAVVKGLAKGPNAFDLHLVMAGTALGVDWDISPAIAIAAPGHAAEVEKKNLDALTAALLPVSETIVGTAHHAYQAADFATFPAHTVLAYAWKHMPGHALDIATGNGHVFVCNEAGYVYEWDAKDGNWNRLPRVGEVTRLAVAPDGAPWLVTRDGRLWHWDSRNRDWQAVRNQIQDVGVGADGAIWVTTKPDVRHKSIWGNNPWMRLISRMDRHKLGPDGAIWRLTRDGRWEHLPGAARRVAVDARGNAWVTNSQGSIYHWTGKGWQELDGWAADIGVDDGKVWVVGSNDTIWNLIPGTGKWVRITGAGINISVDRSGLPWVIGTNGGIYKNLGPKG